jgi:hypothetical protein
MIQEHPSLRLPWLPLALLALSACRCGESYPNQPSVMRSAAAVEVRDQWEPGSNAADPWLPGDPGLTDVMFEIRTQLGARAISPLIYGINFDLHDVAAQRWGVIRAGGNRSTAYNWETNASNAGADYAFQNDSFVSDSDAPAAPLLKIIDAAMSVDAPAIITLSNADYVSADKNGGGDVRQSGPEYLRSRFHANHARKNGAFSGTPDVNDRHVYQDELVAYLKSKRPNARVLLSMDNEPELWSYTHSEIFLTP